MKRITLLLLQQCVTIGYNKNHFLIKESIIFSVYKFIIPYIMLCQKNAFGQHDDAQDAKTVAEETEKLIELETLGLFPSIKAVQEIGKHQQDPLKEFSVGVKSTVRQVIDQNSRVAITAEPNAANWQEESAVKQRIEEIIKESLNFEAEKMNADKIDESYFAKIKRSALSHKKALLLTGLSAIAVASKYTYDHINMYDVCDKQDDFVEQTVAEVNLVGFGTEAVEPEVINPVMVNSDFVDSVIEPKIVVETATVNIASEVDAILEEPVTQAIASNVLHCISKKRNVLNKKIDDLGVKNYSQKLSDYLTARTPEFTTKNAVFATAFLVGLSALMYQLVAMCSKPSFDALVKQYIYETQEQDAAVIIEQFILALEKYGYTSVEDKQKAIQMFINAGLLKP